MSLVFMGRASKLQFLDLVERPPRALCGRELFTFEPVDKSGQPQCIETLTTPVIWRPDEAVDIHPIRWSHL